MEFDTKIAFAIADDLATWQKLNVVAFLKWCHRRYREHHGRDICRWFWCQLLAALCSADDGTDSRACATQYVCSAR